MKKILFNLVHERTALNVVSENDIGLAHSILASICQENGFPVAEGYYDPSLSFDHTYIYKSIRNYVEPLLLGVCVTDYAVLASLGNLKFQLTLHSSNPCIM
ncbi:hypothetical protein AH04_54 [Erwinia phage AH04]|uniref:Uncharacterized protein n=1 Tax=Erwinia phage AH04 TaxID=2869569 RepID=A0AAE7X2T8_9CAUD|nr:hypothetical protein PQC02_gp260 [Erwinia phage AH04]QZA70767.1 hypothetical protein AH04_54 [Erwinia phage AH04]